MTLSTAQDAVVGFELLAAATGFLFWRKIRSTYLQWLPVYLLVVAAGDQVGDLLEGRANIYWYKFGIFMLQFLFFTWFFYQAANRQRKQWYLAAAAMYLLAIVVEELFFDKIKTPFFSLSYMVGCIVLLVHCILYLGTLIRSDELLSYKVNLMFWVCLGVIVFYIATFPYYGLFNTLIKKKYRHIHLAYTWIGCFLNYAMYLLFTIGMICYKPKVK
jgi:hypothetical protein